MKQNILKALVSVVILLTARGSIAQDQPVLNHFYMHGWQNENWTMDNLSNWIHTEGLDWASTPERHTYSSWGRIQWGAENKDADLIAAHPEGRYIGMGYSAGGLITRSIVHRHGFVPPNTPAFVEGFVTLGTPNTGATYAHRWEGHIYKNAVAQNRIGRGEYSFVSYGGLAFWLINATGFTVAGEAIRLGHPFAQDLMPSSDYFRDVNGPALQAIENSIPRGKTTVYGEVTGRKFPAESSTQPNNIVPDQNSYQNQINTARANAHHHDREAERLNRGGWLRRAANWFKRTWNRMRAGDWNASANGWEEMNDAWEWATADRGPSDAFISVQSQTGLPNAIARNRIPGQMNHRNEHRIPNGDQGQYQGTPAVRNAMRDDLGVRFR